jgi:non-specific serine/threonine protein kinase
MVSEERVSCGSRLHVVSGFGRLQPDRDRLSTGGGQPPTGLPPCTAVHPRDSSRKETTFPRIPREDEFEESELTVLAINAPVSLGPVLTPHGRLMLVHADDGLALPHELAVRLEAAFIRGSGHGLLRLGAEEVGTTLPPVLAYWRELAARYVTTLCTHPEIADGKVPVFVPPPELEIERLAGGAPPMTGAEYITPTVLRALWADLDAAFRAELLESNQSPQDFLATKSPAWRLVGRVHFNLAENKADAAAPFAFLATYTTRLSAHAKAQHLPLGQALREYAGAAHKTQLLSLLLPVQRAAAQCGWLKRMVDAGEIYHPLRWTPTEAFQLLTDLPQLAACGVVVRVPGSWRANRPPRPQVSATIGGKVPSGLGADALLDFQVDVTLDGERLTAAEIERLLASSDGLHLVRGRWVELDRAKLTRLLEQFRDVEQTAAAGGLTFAEAMRLVAGANVSGEAVADAPPEWSRITAGPWLADTLDGLRHPDGLARVDPGDRLKTTLRPYQQVGVRWLHLLSTLGLGACLADDMGLGKTIQVLALLLTRGTKQAPGRRTSVLVAPASLLANWSSEIARFAPSLRTLVAHPSAMSSADLKSLDRRALATVDLVVTSYGSLLRVPALIDMPWRLAVLDEAQAIKNPGARQTRAAKQLDAHARIALTGTPVENRLGDLWSIFDFINPGLLGSSKAFSSFTKRLAARPQNPYGPLRDLVRPYILRRMKTDTAVIADLPDKIEVKAYCQLTRAQAALYQQAVNELSAELNRADGITRKGVVLASLMRFKQICNHPSQWLGDNRWLEGDSGKLARLREIATVIGAKQEKALVFTQFREVTAPLAAFLGSVFGRPGLVLHGDTDVKKRHGLVRQFQEDEEVPFFVLSLKAGGTGLNLTAAAHVVHFDRWWNPAVESQATDRAFRIGQTKHVLVHKFLCRGTVEEKIDQLLDSKRQLSEELLEGGAELLLTEMNNDELLKLVALDVHAALPE